MKGRTVLIIAGIGVAALAIYLYLKRGGIHASDRQDTQSAGADQITASFRGIAGDDPSTIRGNLEGTGQFQVSSTENKTAVEQFLGYRLAGYGGSVRTTRGGLLPMEKA